MISEKNLRTLDGGMCVGVQNSAVHFKRPWRSVWVRNATGEGHESQNEWYKSQRAQYTRETTDLLFWLKRVRPAQSHNIAFPLHLHTDFSGHEADFARAQATGQ